MKKKIAYFLGSIIFLVYIVNVIGLKNIYDTFASLDSLIIIIAFLIALSWSFVDCFKWSIFLSRINKVRFSKLLPIYFSGDMFNALTPGAKSGGEIVKAHYTSKLFDIPQSKVYATILLDKSILMAVFAVMLMMTSLYTVLFLKIPSVITGIFRVSLGLVVLLSVVIILVNQKYWIRKNEILFSILNFIYHLRVFEFIKRRFETYKIFEDFIMGIFSEFFESFNMLLEHKKGVLTNIILSVLMFFLSFARVWVLFIGLSYDIDLILIIVVVTLGSAISYMMLTPGGAGVTEIALISLYVAVGVDPDVAAIVALVDRGMYYVISFGIGYVATVYLKIKN
ncbi:MAG: flippase-like domain-containing protein [DPANN group archaeon]|nr:flippase-like domain-containing protein [DPANN group archaeon]